MGEGLPTVQCSWRRCGRAHDAVPRIASSKVHFSYYRFGLSPYFVISSLWISALFSIGVTRPLFAEGEALSKFIWGDFSFADFSLSDEITFKQLWEPAHCQCNDYRPWHFRDWGKAGSLLHQPSYQDLHQWFGAQVPQVLKP